MNVEILINYITYCRTIYHCLTYESNRDCGEYSPIELRFCRWGVDNMPKMKLKYKDFIEEDSEARKQGDEYGNDTLEAFIKESDKKYMLTTMLRMEQKDSEFVVYIEDLNIHLKDKNSFVEFLWDKFVGNGEE